MIGLGKDNPQLGFNQPNHQTQPTKAYTTPESPPKLEPLTNNWATLDAAAENIKSATAQIKIKFLFTHIEVTQIKWHSWTIKYENSYLSNAISKS